MSSGLTFSQIHAQVAAIPLNARSGKAVGIYSTSRWQGAPQRSHENQTFSIRQCNSPLAIREALRNPLDGTITVVVTPIDDRDLDWDIRVRLAKRELFRIDRWQMVKSMFRAASVDPRLAKSSWIADKLIEMQLQHDFPTAPGGFLNADIVWPLLLANVVGMKSDTYDLPSILQWSTNTESVRSWKDADDAFRQEATGWLAKSAGSVTELVLRVVESNQDPVALPLGLVMDVLTNPGHSSELGIQQVRFEERYLNGESISHDLLRRWASASRNVVQFQLHDPGLFKQVLDRADAILKDIDAQAVAFVSDVSPMGFDQRLANFGKTLSRQIEQNALSYTDALKQQCQSIHEHLKANAEPQRLERVKMAVRLLRWIGKESAAPTKFNTFVHAADYQLADGAFADWARLELFVSEPVGALSTAYQQLFQLATKIRENQSKRFAELLADWTKAGSPPTEYLGIENVLANVLKPIAKDRPVLMIVLDGMNTAVFRELMADIVSRRNWYWAVPQEQGRLSGALAVIPSVTERSRASLFAGKLVRGNAEHESRSFARHDELLTVCKASFPPEVFHKASLAPSSDGDLTSGVRESISDTDRQIVSVVVNAIDDHLEKGQQLEVSWTRDGIKVLPLLLHEAKSVGRSVLVLSDHGHIIDTQTEYRAATDGGERWRPADGAPSNQETLIDGSRVVADGGQVTVPWSEQVRYTSARKNGYHGGVNPQEMVIPLALLCPDETLPDGWIEAPQDDPDWWDEQYLHIELPTLEPVAPKGYLFDKVAPKPEESTASATTAEPSPLPETPSTVVPDWVTALMDSLIFVSQKKLVRRGLPSDEKITLMLVALDQRGGKLTSVALARAISEPPMRIHGFFANVKRVLDVDGYGVLTKDQASDTITLNKELLLKQFGLEE